MPLLSDAAKNLILEIPEAPDPLAQQVVLEAARAFCRQSTAMRRTLPRIDIVSGQGAYTLSPPAGEEIVEIVRAVNVLTNTQYERRTREQLMWGQTSALTTTGTTEFFVFDPPTDLTLAPIPATGGTQALELRVATMPAADATSIPDDLWATWEDAVLEGARFRLYRLPRRPWSDGSAAAAALDLFDGYVARARRIAADGGTISPRRNVRGG